MDYDFRKIEQKWQSRWAAEKTYKTVEDASKPKFYVLDMFPYPSGAGLHVGHPLGYIASDIAYIVNDAAMGAAFSDKPITQELLEATIKSIHPSISKDVVNSYENLRQKMEDVDTRNKRPKIGFIQ